MNLLTIEILWFWSVVQLSQDPGHKRNIIPDTSLSTFELYYDM